MWFIIIESWLLLTLYLLSIFGDGPTGQKGMNNRIAHHGWFWKYHHRQHVDTSLHGGIVILKQWLLKQLVGSLRNHCWPRNLCLSYTVALKRGHQPGTSSACLLGCQSRNGIEHPGHATDTQVSVLHCQLSPQSEQERGWMWPSRETKEVIQVTPMKWNN